MAIGPAVAALSKDQKDRLKAIEDALDPLLEEWQQGHEKTVLSRAFPLPPFAKAKLRGALVERYVATGGWKLVTTRPGASGDEIFFECK